MKRFNPYFKFATLVLSALVVWEIIYLLPAFKRGQPLTVYASQVVEKCAGESWKPGCYDREIPKLMDVLSMEDAFKVVQLVQENDHEYLYCHVVAHELSSKEAEKNPDAWEDVITRCPTAICNNGCLHGAMMERFNQESLTTEQIEVLKPDLKDLCEPRGKWNPVESERSMCYHGLGHLFMFITDAEINQSLKLCEYVGVKPDKRDYLQTCSQGVFMTLYQPLEPEDFALVDGVAPKNMRERDTLCGRFTGLYWESCMAESWPLYREKMLNSGDDNHLVNIGAMNEFCSYATTPVVQRKCYETALSMIAVVVMINHHDSAQYARVCTELPEAVQSTCFTFGVHRLMQIDSKLSDDATAFCSMAKSNGFEVACYDQMVYDALRVFHGGSEEKKSFCNKLPPRWKEKCLDNN